MAWSVSLSNQLYYQFSIGVVVLSILLDNDIFPRLVTVDSLMEITHVPRCMEQSTSVVVLSQKCQNHWQAIPRCQVLKITCSSRSPTVCETGRSVKRHRSRRDGSGTVITGRPRRYVTVTSATNKHFTLNKLKDYPSKLFYIYQKSITRSAFLVHYLHLCTLQIEMSLCFNLRLI